MTEKRCPACGADDMRTSVFVGGISLCRLCASGESMQMALKIARSKHREKLEQIWAALQRE